MRLSANKDDPGYLKYVAEKKSNDISVLCDGRPLEHCITVDTFLGFAEVAETDAEGRVVANRLGDGVLTRTVRGSIEVIFKPHRG